MVLRQAIHLSRFSFTQPLALLQMTIAPHIIDARSKKEDIINEATVLIDDQSEKIIGLKEQVKAQWIIAFIIAFLCYLH